MPKILWLLLLQSFFVPVFQLSIYNNLLFYIDEFMNYEEAKNKCTPKYGKMLTILNMDEVEEYRKESYDLLKRWPMKGKELWMNVWLGDIHEKEGKLYWYDGRPVPVGMFEHPPTLHNGTACVFSYAGEKDYKYGMIQTVSCDAKFLIAACIDKRHKRKETSNNTMTASVHVAKSKTAPTTTRIIFKKDKQ